MPDGPWVGPNSPYVEALIEGIEIWEESLDAYIEAQEGDAGHLADLDLEAVGPVPGPEDADATDVEVAVVFSPTFPGAVAIQYSSEGQMQACSIVLPQWLIYSSTPEDVQNLFLHELGHCLALEHPDQPAHDLMESEYNFHIGQESNPQECLSTLDLAGIAKAWAWLETGTWSEAEGNATVPVDDYEKIHTGLHREPCSARQV